MATESIVGGLFGMTPESYQDTRQLLEQRQALAQAQLDPYEAVNYMAARAGQQLGRGIGGLLGAEDPQLKIIGARNAVMREVDPNNPISLQNAIQRLSSAGDQAGALLLSDYLRKAQSDYALIQQRTAEKMTPEQRNALASATLRQQINQVTNQPDSDEKTSTLTFLRNQLSALITPKPDKVADAIQIANEVGTLTQDLRTLEDMGMGKGNPRYDALTAQIKRLDNSKDKFSPFAQTLIDAGIDPNSQGFRNRMLEYVNAKIEGTKKGQGVTIGGISIDSGEASKAAGKLVADRLVNIQDQYSLKESIEEAMKLVTAGVYGGGYGPEKAALQKFAGLGSQEKLERTEQLRSYIGEVVIPRLKDFGGNDSNEELKYLQRVLGGDERLEPKALEKILASTERKVNANIKRLQLQQESATSKTPLGVTPLPSTAVEKPNAPSQTKAIKFNSLNQ